jgi:hypothetical protein
MVVKPDDPGVKTQLLRIKDELKYLHMKKQQLNTKLYQLHLLLANTWGNAWQYIQHTINRNLEKETKPIYQRLDNKLHKLALEQTNTPKSHHTFYPRIVNNTDITFSSKEIELLEKGPKYNLHHKKKNWLINLASSNSGGSVKHALTRSLASGVGVTVEVP